MCTFSPQEETCCTPPTEDSLQLWAVVGMMAFAYSRIPTHSLYHIRHRKSRASAKFTEKSFSPLQGRSLRSLPRLRYAHAPRRYAPRSPAGGSLAMGCGVPAPPCASAPGCVRLCPRPLVLLGGLRLCGGVCGGGAGTARALVRQLPAAARSPPRSDNAVRW